MTTLEEEVQSGYHSKTGKQLGDEVRDIINVFLPIPDMSRLLLKYPKAFANNVFDNNDTYPYLCLPCHLLDLTDILESKKSWKPNTNALFSFNVVKSNFTNYPIVLMMGRAIEKQADCSVGGIAVYRSGTIALEGVVKVLIRDYVPEQKMHEIENLVYRYCPDASVHILTNPPGMDTSFDKTAGWSDPTVFNKPDNKGEFYTKLELPKEMTTFSVGDRVRSRHRGIAFKPMNGRVKRINQNLMFVRWDEREEEQVFDLDNTIHLHLSIQKY